MASNRTSILPADVANMQFAVGQAIQRRRKEKGLSQEEFGHLIEKSADLVSSLERGISFTSMGTLLKIAAVLQCRIAELFEGEAGEQEPEELRRIALLLKDQPTEVRAAAEQQIRILVAAANRGQ